MAEHFVHQCPRCDQATAHKSCFLPEHSACIVCLWCRLHHAAEDTTEAKPTAGQ